MIFKKYKFLFSEQSGARSSVLGLVVPTARPHLNSPTFFFFFGLEVGCWEGSDLTARDCGGQRPEEGFVVGFFLF